MVHPPNRPWYRLHWLTWLVLAIVVWALIEREREKEFEASFGSAGIDTTIARFGWPKRHLMEVESISAFPKPGELPTSTNHWTSSNLSFNLLFCLLLTAATAHVFERWLRSPNRLHVSLGSLLGLIGVAAILTGIVNGNINDSLSWLGLPTLYLTDWYDLRQPLKWPLMLALGCTIYSSGRLASLAALRLSALLRPSHR